MIAAVASSDPSSALLLFRVGFSLAIVVGVIWITARVLRKGGKSSRPGAGPAIEVVERRNLGRRSNLVLVRVGGAAFLVGATDQRVELVAAVPGLDANPDPDPVVVSEIADAAPIARIVPAVSADLVDLDAARTNRTAAPVRAATGAPGKVSLMDAVRDLTVRRG